MGPLDIPGSSLDTVEAGLGERVEAAGPLKAWAQDTKMLLLILCHWSRPVPRPTQVQGEGMDSAA